MRIALYIVVLFAFIGCSATAKGIKEDAVNAKDWTKQKINDAATSVKEATE